MTTVVANWQLLWYAFQKTAGVGPAANLEVFMRQLILHRERALAGFAIRYFGVLDRDPAAFVAELERSAETARFAHVGDCALRNGETVSLNLDDGPHTLFVIIYTESRNVVTNLVTIDAGREDAEFTVRTEYDGYRKLQFVLGPTEG
jgi:hypothetical protein